MPEAEIDQEIDFAQALPPEVEERLGIINDPTQKLALHFALTGEGEHDLIAAMKGRSARIINAQLERAHTQAAKRRTFFWRDC